MSKKQIKLTENDLRNIVKESVKKLLKEANLTIEEYKEWALEAPSYLILDIVENYVDEPTFESILQDICDSLR